MDGSSPTSATGSPVAEMLTPGSKVAKMLADIDNAPTPSPPARTSAKDAAIESVGTDQRSARFFPRVSSVPSPSKPGSAQRHQQRTELASDTGSGSDAEDDLMDAVRSKRPRPLGHAARRMWARQTSPSETSSTHASSPAAPQTAAHQESVDEDLYSATPRKVRSTAVSITGSPLNNDAGGLFVSPAKSGNLDAGTDEDLPSNPFGSKDKLAELVAKKREERLRREAEEQREMRERERALASSGAIHKKRLKQRKQRSSPSTAHASSDLPTEVLQGSQEALEPNPDVERIMSDAARPTRKASKKALLEMERETQRLARQQALAHQMKVKKKFTTSDLLARFSTRTPQRSQPADARDGSSSAPNSDGVDMTPRKPVSTPPSSPPTAGPTPLDKQKAMVELGALSKLVPVREDSIASLAQMADSDDELPDMADILSSARDAKGHGLDTATEAPAPAAQPPQQRKGLKLARLGKKAMVQHPHEDSDDDDLDIIAPMPKHLRMFDNIKPHDKHTSTDNKALHALKHLAHLGAYEVMPSNKRGKGPSRPSIGSKTLEAQLRRKAKEQARLMQKERIEELRAKGIDVQTAEEREREAEVFESLLEKARVEAVELRKAEKNAAALEGGTEGQALGVSEDEDEDEEYVDSGSEEGEGGEGLVDEAAGESDGEDEEEGEAEDEEEVGDEGGDQGSAEELLAEPEVHEDPLEPTHDPTVTKAFTRKARQSRVVQDDDDEDMELTGLALPQNIAADADDDDDHDMELTTPGHPPNVAADEEDPFAAFNFGANADALMSPTQAFQATMQTPTQATQEDSFDILRRIAGPPSASSISLPPTFPSAQGVESQEIGDESQESGMVLGSQVPESQRVSLQWETQQELVPMTPKLGRQASGLSETPGWEPTQDAGLASPWIVGNVAHPTPVEDEHETQSTVQLRVSESPAPLASAPRRGRLVRRQAAAEADSSDDDDQETETPAVPSAKKRHAEEQNAFREMARRRAAALTEAERAEAEKEMKQMLEEQAEESEDEYAGLGGDDFVAAETEEDKAMIDTSNVEVDERALAAHYAARQRVADEEATSKLFKDVTTGGLRRRQANNAFDLEEDEDELAMRRRELRQREEARKRKVLLRDDKLAGLLTTGKQSKGKDAFLRAIADEDAEARDFDDEDDGSFDDSTNPEEDSQATATQEGSQPQQEQASGAPQPLREVSGNNNKRPRPTEDEDSRPPAKQRRTQASAFRKPASLLEVRESVSFLLEEPDAGLVAPTLDAMDSEDEDAASGDDEDADHEDTDDEEEELEKSRQNDGGFAPNTAAFDARAMPPPRLPASQRRTAPKATVVDRLSLKRGASTSLAQNAPQHRTAWAATTTNAKAAPSLLRRATTNTGNSNERGVSTNNGSNASLSREGSGSGVRMGGSKKSSLAYQARAEERRAIVDAGVRKREANTARIAAMRRESSRGSGLGAVGRFE